jgi:hypothetical protein
LKYTCPCCVRAGIGSLTPDWKKGSPGRKLTLGIVHFRVDTLTSRRIWGF